MQLYGPIFLAMGSRRRIMSSRSPSIEFDQPRFYETIVLKTKPNQNQTKKNKRKELRKDDKKEDKKKKRTEF